MSKYWRWLIPAYLWCLPMSMAGFVIAHVFYRAGSWKWYKGAFTCVAGTDANGETLIWGRPNAQTLGWIVIFDNGDHRNEPDLRVHEYTHIAQAFMGGVLGTLLMPLLFAVLGANPLWGLALGGVIGGLGFALLYGILFLYLLVTLKTEWYWAYRRNPFEVQAYNVQDAYLNNPDPNTWGV